MKTFMAAVLMFVSVQSMASEFTCFNNSDSDYQLDVTVNQDGPQAVRLSNQNWGQAGIGEFQSVSQLPTSDYVIAGESDAKIGLIKGQLIHFVFNQDQLKSLEIFESNGQSESYRCQ